MRPISHTPTLLLMCLASAADAGDLFVRAGGNDSASGTSPAQAWATVAHAATRVSPGDTVYVGAGTFNGQVRPARGGTGSEPIAFVADVSGARTGDAGTVTIRHYPSQPAVYIKNADHVTFTGFVVEGGQDSVFLDDASGIVLGSCTLDGARDRAVYVGNGSEATIKGCTIRSTVHGVRISNGAVRFSDGRVHDLSGEAFYVHSAGAEAVIRRTRITDVRRGAQADNGRLAMINVLVHETSQEGVVTRNNTELIMVHCTIDSTVREGARFAGRSTLYNNIFSNIGSHCMRLDGGTFDVSNNLVYNRRGYRSMGFHSPNEFQMNPRFADASRDDFTLLSGSQAIGRALDKSEYTVLDLAGSDRPQGGAADLGAFEFVEPELDAFASIPYRNEDGRDGPEWLGVRTGSFSELGGVFGMHGKRNRVDERIKLGLRTIPGRRYLLAFELVAFDGWEPAGRYRDVFSVSIDGVRLFESSLTDQQTDRFTNIGEGSRSDRISTMNTVWFTASGDETAVSFFGDMTGGLHDEGWGIDKIVVVDAADHRLAAPISEGFESVPETGWIDTTQSSTGAFGGTHGAFGHNNRNAAMLLAETEPGKEYAIRFDLILAPSWDPDDEIRVRVDGVDVLARSLGTGMGQTDPLSFGGAEPAVELSHTVFRGVRAAFTASGETSLIEFRSDSSGPASIAGWMLDNVTVRERTGEVRIVRWRELSPIGEND